MRKMSRKNLKEAREIKKQFDLKANEIKEGKKGDLEK